MVARVAGAMGEALNQKGGKLKLPLILAGALLHDIAKTRSVREGGNHVAMGRKMVLEMGYPEVAWLVGSHVDLGPEIANTIDEATVVNYGDKRVEHDKVVPLRERFEALVTRYGKTAEDRVRFQQMYGNMERLEKQIFGRISLSPDDLIFMIERSAPVFWLKPRSSSATGSKDSG